MYIFPPLGKMVVGGYKIENIVKYRKKRMALKSKNCNKILTTSSQ